MEKSSDATEVAILTGSSGKLAKAIEDCALAIILSRNEDQYPLSREDISGEVEALYTYLEGLQDPDSDLFVDRSQV